MLNMCLKTRTQSLACEAIVHPRSLKLEHAKGWINPAPLISYATYTYTMVFAECAGAQANDTVATPNVAQDGTIYVGSSDR